METEHKFKLEMTSMLLHLIAMLSMLCDHLWGTVIPGKSSSASAGVIPRGDGNAPGLTS